MYVYSDLLRDEIMESKLEAVMALAALLQVYGCIDFCCIFCALDFHMLQLTVRFDQLEDCFCYLIKFIAFLLVILDLCDLIVIIKDKRLADFAGS